MLSERQLKVLQRVADGTRCFGPATADAEADGLIALKEFQPEAEEIVELGENGYLERVNPNRESSSAYGYIDLIMVKGLTAKGRKALDEARGNRRLVVLKKIYDHVGDSITEAISFDEFTREMSFSSDEANAVLSYLNSKGYLGDTNAVGLSHEGIVEAERIITDQEEAVRILGGHSREDELQVREREARRYRVLRRLYDMSGADVDRGVPYYKLQEAERLDELQWWAVQDYLIAEGLIRERANLEITERGIDEIERSQRSPQTSTEHFSGTVIQNYYGNVGSVQTGSHSTAVVTQHQNSNTELLPLIERLVEALEALPVRPGVEDALEQTEMLREEAQLQIPRLKRIKSYLSAIGVLAGDTSVDLATGDISKLIESQAKPV
jgi:hypothetical protein